MYRYIFLFVLNFCIILNAYGQTEAVELLEEQDELTAHEAIGVNNGNDNSGVLNQFMKDEALSSDENDLIQAVFVHDSSKAKALLEKGINHNISYKIKQKDNSTFETTLIHLTIAGNEREVFDALLSYKDISVNKTGYIAVKKDNSISYVEMTPVAYAVYVNNGYMVEKLLEKGADPNKYGVGSYPAVFYASDEKILSMLNRHKADFNILADNNTRPLFEAVKSNKSQLVKKLLDNGADINKKDGEGNTLLYTAISLGYYDMARYLIDKNAKVDEPSSKSKITPLMAALERHDHDIGFLRYLIFKGANVNTRDSRNRTPLFYIYDYQSENDIDNIKESLSVLMDNKADINAQDVDGNTILHLKPQNYYEIYSAYTPNINKINKDGNTPLHTAAFMDNVTSILTGSPDKNIKNKKGETALTLASKKGYKTTVSYLSLPEGEILLLLGGLYGDVKLIDKALKYKVDVNKNIMGHLPVYYAAKGGNAEVFRTLIKAGARLDAVSNLVYDTIGSFQKDSDQNNRVELLKIFIDNEVSLHWDKYKDFLHKLITEQSDKNLGQGYIRTVLAYAVSKGADPNILDDNGKAPIHTASAGMYDSYDLVLELISSGADVDMLDNNNMPAIYYCASAPYNKDKVFLALLNNIKLDINAVYGNEGNTLLMEAAKNGNKSIVLMLIARGADDMLVNKHGKTALMLAKDAFKTKYSSASVDEKNSSDYKNYQFLAERFLFDKNTIAECRSGINEECKKYYKPVEVINSSSEQNIE